MKNTFAILMMVVAFAITGCDKGAIKGDVAAPSTLSGTYASKNATLVFTAGGDVVNKGTPIFPGDKKTTYKIDGGKVNFKFPEGLPMTLSINSDGSLSSEPLRDVVYKKVD